MSSVWSHEKKWCLLLRKPPGFPNTTFPQAAHDPTHEQTPGHLPGFTHQVGTHCPHPHCPRPHLASPFSLGDWFPLQKLWKKLSFFPPGKPRSRGLFGTALSLRPTGPQLQPSGPRATHPAGGSLRHPSPPAPPTRLQSRRGRCSRPLSLPTFTFFSPAESAAVLASQNKVEESLLRYHMLQKVDSAKVKGVLLLRNILLGRVPSWEDLVWFEKRFKAFLGEPKPAKEDQSILNSLLALSEAKLSSHRRFTKFESRIYKEHLATVNTPILWQEAPFILQDLFQNFEQYGSNFACALRSTLESLPPTWASRFPQGMSCKVTLHKPEVLEFVVDAAFFSAWDFSPRLYLKELSSLYVPFWRNGGRVILRAWRTWEKLNLVFYIPNSWTSYREQLEIQNVDFCAMRTLRLSSKSDRIQSKHVLVRDLNKLVHRMRKNFKLCSNPDPFRRTSHTSTFSQLCPPRHRSPKPSLVRRLFRVRGKLL